jgi:hypothetical protein
MLELLYRPVTVLNMTETAISGRQCWNRKAGSVRRCKWR